MLYTILNKIEVFILELLKRYFIFAVGLCFSSMGIVLVTKAGLGTSPISSIPYVLSAILPMTFGQFTFIINVLFIILQIVILKKDFKKFQVLQVLISFMLGSFIDFFMFVFSELNTSSYVSQIIFLLAGCAILGLGISLQIIADVIMISGDALVKVISTRLAKNYGTVKTIFDVSLVIIAASISVVKLGSIAGLREGTVIAALLVGSIARFFIDKLVFINDFFVSGVSEEC